LENNTNIQKSKIAVPPQSQPEVYRTTIERKKNTKLQPLTIPEGNFQTKPKTFIISKNHIKHIVPAISFR